jgi:hypothetical protein
VSRAVGARFCSATVMVVVLVHAVAQPVQAVSQFVQAVAEAMHDMAVAEMARVGL